MIANPDTFQTIIMIKRRENQITHKLKIYNNEIEKTNAKIRPHDIIVRRHNAATYSDKSLTALGPKI